MESNHQTFLDLTLTLGSLQSFIQEPQFLQLLKMIIDQNKEKIEELKQKDPSFIQNYWKYLEKTCQEIKSCENPSCSLKQKRMYLEGVFDIVHSGHFNAIRQAKAMTEILVVGIVSDEETLKHKGSVRACKWVDEVVEGVEYNPTIEQLDRFNCQYNCHGDDIPLDSNGMETNLEIRNAGRLKLFH